MGRKKSYLTVTDQFCGAGGSSQGVRNVAGIIGGGLEVKLAMNHWKLAIETHNTNFPDAIHDCTDISACDPRRYPSTDILITSPECTNHSLAKGVKIAKKQMGLFDTGKIDPAAERSRATMWDVPRFAEYHNYNLIIVENVVDARKWVMFESWLMAMHALGYCHKCVYLNSMFCYPTPQSRDRMYVVFWKKGNKAPNLDFTPVAWCHKCRKDIHAIQTWKDHRKQYGKYKQQYVYCCPHDNTVVEPYYYAAFNCIDWSDLGVKIGERGKPLSPKTVGRINYGLKKYGNHPFLINDQHSTGTSFRVKRTTEYIPTIPSTHQLKLLTPFIIKCEHSENMSSCRSVAESLQTHTTRQSMALISQPFIIEMYNSGTARNVSDELNTVTAGGVKSGIVTDESFKSFISYYYGQDQASAITDAIGSCTTKERHSLVQYKEPVLEECYYRMLKPEEIKLAMAFEKNYIVLGNSKDRVKQLGNAVTPPAMSWLVQQGLQTFN